MREKTIYVADDGKEFEYKEDCLEHELDLKLESMPVGCLRFYNIDKKEVLFDDLTQPVFYIVITDKRAVPYLDIWGDKHNVYTPFDFNEHDIDDPCGIYYWDDSYDSWIEYKQAKQLFNEIWEGIADAV